jgi:hypothetical protein
MEDFIPDKEYYFTGSSSKIENFVGKSKSNDEKIYLGKFIEYIGVPYVTDWLPNGKARFEKGIISKGYYHETTEQKKYFDII